MQQVCKYLQKVLNSLVLLAFLASYGPIGVADEIQPRIVVSGEGSVELAPDMAVLTLMVTREGQTARAALDANTAAMAQVLKGMRARGIEERDLQTANFSIQPRYAQVPRTAAGERPAPRIEGYTVRNGLTVKVRKLDALGEIIDESVTLGVNEGGQVRFSNADPGPALEQARRKAVADAIARAATLATAAGVKVGKVLELAEYSRYPGPVPLAAAADMAVMRAAESIPVAVGESSYQVRVNLSVAIEQ